ncbi:MAG: hypothetical protein GDA67_04605 [Nitrospira sp. CR1.3]|nr:hypothetical protein [Nitrospira sp. CR1.3]
MNLTERQASYHRTGLASFLVLLATVVAVEAESAPRRPSNTAEACSLSGEKLDELRAKNPGAMNACGDLANRAAKEGRSFSFMCDGNSVSCCDDKQCISVATMKARIPGGLRPDQLPTLQQTPTAPGGMRAPTTGTITPRGVEGEIPTASEQEGK